MTLRSVMLQLREDQIAQLDAHARRTARSRSSLVREAVDAALVVPQNQDVAEQYAAAYPDAVLGADEWGDLDAWHTAAELDRARSKPDPW